MRDTFKLWTLQAEHLLNRKPKPRRSLPAHKMDERKATKKRLSEGLSAPFLGFDDVMFMGDGDAR